MMEAPSTDHCSSPACWGCHGIRQRLSAGKGHSQYPEQCHPSLTGGGAEVFIHLTPSVLTVTNTGTSIPEEDLPVLFTPFYRVEKSRNKSTGGCGLGLYLVKTILELHGFQYRVENTETGVVFTVEF